MAAPRICGLLAISALLALPPTAHASDPAPPAAVATPERTPYVRFKIPDGLTRAQAMNCVIYSLTTQHWKISARNETTVTAVLLHREWNATVELVCHETEIEMRHHTLRSGKPAMNRGWLERIRIEAESRFKVELQRRPIASSATTVAADK